ncbi:MAG TPA: hypothetical protein VIK27_08660 [Candidatus Aquilonibacter sp.]
MPKRILLIALAAASLVLVACGNAYNPNNLYGTPPPAATPTPATTPNPTVTAAIVTVMVSSSPLPNQPVSLYTDVNGHKGTLVLTQSTGSAGTTTFTGLTGAANYCFESSYTPPGSLQQNESICTDLWGFGITMAF